MQGGMALALMGSLSESMNQIEIALLYFRLQLYYAIR